MKKNLIKYLTFNEKPYKSNSDLTEFSFEKWQTWPLADQSNFAILL